MTAVQVCFLLLLEIETTGAPKGSHSWVPRAIAALFIIVVALFWAVKNRFTDYP